PLLILIAHSLLFWLGKMASSGELRYMLIVAPFWGVLSARGWVWIFERIRWPAMYRLAGAAALVPGFINFDYYQVVPITPSDDLRQAHQAADWFEHWPMRDQFPRLLASNIGVHYYLDISPTDRLRTREWRKSVIAQAQPGTIIIWDPVFGVYNSDAT